MKWGGYIQKFTMRAYSNSSGSNIQTISQTKTERSAITADSYIPQSMPKWLVTVAHHPDALAETGHSLAAKNLGAAAEVRSTCPKMVPTVIIFWME